MTPDASSDDAHLIETCLRSETLFEGRFLKVRRDTVRQPGGREAVREYVVHPGAVVVIGLLDDGRVLVERQFRYPVGRVMTEFPVTVQGELKRTELKAKLNGGGPALVLHTSGGNVRVKKL